MKPSVFAPRLAATLLALFTALTPLAYTTHAAQTTNAPAAVSNSAMPRVKLATSLGEIVVELDTRAAPLSTANFLQYVRDGFYKGTVFHRVIRGFMIQGGGLDAGMHQKRTRDAIKLESNNGLKNVRGSLAMARTHVPDSATSQFFINVVDNPMLDAPSPDGYGYAVFGRVVQGMEVVDKIRDVPVTTMGINQNVPEKPVVIESATLMEAASK